jgi:hypothetical protein
LRAATAPARRRGSVHDRCVELDLADEIRVAAVPDRVVVGVVLDPPRPRLHRIESGPTALEDLPRGVDPHRAFALATTSTPEPSCDVTSASIT